LLISRESVERERKRKKEKEDDQKGLEARHARDQKRG